MLEINLPFKAFSVNAMNYRDSRFKTAEYKAWHEQIKSYIEENYSKQLNELNQDFNDWQIVYSVRIEVVYPPHLLFNANGGISSKSFDLSNVEKPLIDIIFRYGMAVDDKNIVELTSVKIPGATFAINVIICPLDMSEYQAMY